MSYNPENQYRCTIIRGKSQTEMEDLLPLYAKMVHTYCPCEEAVFKDSCRRVLSKAIFNNPMYDMLSEPNRKTVDNHLTEIAGTLLGLYYAEYDEDSGKNLVIETEACKFLVDSNDQTTFFKNLCLNFQFPNGAKWLKFVQQDIENGINIKPFCYVVKLLYIAQQHSDLLSKQEIGFYVLNNLDVLQGKITCDEVYNRILADRKNKVKRDKLSGSRDWQHIKEQFNLLELANIIECDTNDIWLNKDEDRAISIFINHISSPKFDCSVYDFRNPVSQKLFISEWRQYYGKFNEELLSAQTSFNATSIVVADRDSLHPTGTTIKSSTDLGDEGEALVFALEQERVRKYKERLVNKVLLLGKTKGLGYDISSIEADDNPLKPEFARYIEVKATRRVTVPSFDSGWSDSVNLTTKEWVAAEQYGEYYNIYRVYFTKKQTIIIRIKNPYAKAMSGKLEVYPTIYQMNFDANVIENKMCL